LERIFTCIRAPPNACVVSVFPLKNKCFPATFEKKITCIRAPPLLLCSQAAQWLREHAVVCVWVGVWESESECLQRGSERVWKSKDIVSVYTGGEGEFVYRESEWV